MSCNLNLFCLVLIYSLVSMLRCYLLLYYFILSDNKIIYLRKVWRIIGNLSPRRFRATATSITEGAWVRERRRSRQITKVKRKQVLATETFRNLPRNLTKTSLKKMSFREIREILLLAYDSKIVSDEEFLVLWESYQSKNPEFPYSSYARFDLQNNDATECLAEFRVQK